MRIMGMKELFHGGLEQRIDSYATEIILEDGEVDFVKACQNPGHVANRLERWDHYLTDILEQGVFADAPSLLARQTEEDVTSMKFFLYHAVLSYGENV